jgi:spore maturation protein CgeB
MGGCMLVEDTAEHRTIFGENDDAVVYFRSVSEGVSGARALVADPARRNRLATKAHALVASGHHTYTDRLRTMVAAEA